MDTISYTTRDEVTHSIMRPVDVGRNALDVMEEAGALFDVYYPPATWEAAYEHPVVGSGVNEGTARYKWVVRADTDEPLGLHSGTFAQSGSYRGVGEMAEQLFPGTTTSCTLFGKGERMTLTQDIGDPIDLGDGDMIQPSLMWISSFNGQWSTSVYDLIGRLFCTNQLIGADPIFSVKHTKNHDITFEQRTNILHETIEHAHAVGRMARVLKDQDFTNSQFDMLIKDVVPLPRPNADGEIHARGERRTNMCRDAMVAKWNEECVEFGTVHKKVKSPSEQVEVFDGNKWLAYNAVQGAEQHVINAQFKTTIEAREKALTKAVNGKTQYALKAWEVLCGAAA